jgi:hypothetical protein
VSKSGKNFILLAFALGACCSFYAWVIWSIPGEYQGDSYDYFSYAARLRSWTYTIDETSYLRGFLYPAFLAVTWGTTGTLTYFLQGALFLSSLALGVFVLARGSAFALLPVLVAILPSVAYLQNLIYPDGIYTSLCILFLCAVAKHKYFLGTFIAILLSLTKLIFVITIPIVLVVWVLQTYPISRKLVIGAVAAAPFAVGVFIFTFFFLFRDLGYMVAFARPYQAGYAIEGVFPNRDVTFACGGKSHSLPRAEVYLDPVTVPHTVAKYGPFTMEQALGFGCTHSDLRRIKGHLLAAGFLEHPLLHARLGAIYFGCALVGANYLNHVSYMIGYRHSIWLKNYNPDSIFTPVERRRIREIGDLGFNIDPAGPAFFFDLEEWWLHGRLYLRVILMVVLLASLAWAWKAGTVTRLLRDPGNQGIVLFLIGYSLFLTVSTPFLVDRYTSICFLAFAFLAARLAAETPAEALIVTGAGALMRTLSSFPTELATNPRARRVLLAAYCVVGLLTLAFQIHVRSGPCTIAGNCASSYAKAVVWSAFWPASWVAYLTPVGAAPCVIRGVC